MLFLLSIMSGPGGWTSSGVEFSAKEHGLHFFYFNNHRVEELPLDTLSSTKELANTPSPKGPGIYVLESRGGGGVGIQATEDCVTTVCAKWGIPVPFLQRIIAPGSLPRLEYFLEQSEPCTEIRRLNGVNVGFRWGPGHSTFILAFGRYDVANSTLMMLLSSKNLLVDDALKSKILAFPSVSDLIQRSRNELGEHPLMFIGILFECCERYMDLCSQQYNLNILRRGGSLESLYSSDLAQWLDGWGIRATEESGKRIDLFSDYNDVTWGGKNCQELIDIGRQYLWLADDLDRSYHCEIPTKLVRDAVHRVEIHAHTFTYLEKVITTQFNYQYNYFMQKDTEATIQISKSSKDIAAASQRDSASMKTVAYLTLAFLPATFVSAIFSTTIFDFQKWHGAANSPQVVSPGWWVFVLSCATATVVTLGIWFPWHGQRNGIQRSLRKVQEDERGIRNV